MKDSKRVTVLPQMNLLSPNGNKGKLHAGAKFEAFRKPEQDS